MLKILLTIGFLQVLTMFVQLVRTKTLALLLGPEMLGAMSVIDRLLQVIVQTLALSLPFAALRFLPALWGTDRAAFVDLARRMRLLLSTLSLAAVAIGIGATVIDPGLWSGELLPYRNVLLVGFLTLPVLTLVPYLQNAIAGRLQQYQAMVFALLHAVVLTVAAIVGVWWAGLRGFYLAYAALGLPLIWWGTRRVEVLNVGAVATLARSAAPRFWLPTAVWRFSLPMLSLGFLAPYAALAVQYEILTLYGAEATGWMQAALGVSLAVRGVLGSAHPVFLTPQLNREGTPQDRLDRATAFQKTLCFLVGLAVPPVLLAPQLFVRVLYSAAFLPGAAFVAWFVMVEVLTLFSGTYQGMILALNHVAYHVVFNVTALLILVGVALALIPRYGIMGAGVGLLCAPTFHYLATLTFLRAKHGLRVPTAQFALTGFVMAVLVACGVTGVRFPTLEVGVIAGKVGLYAASIAVLALFLTGEDRRNLVRLAEGLRRRVRPAA